jgi:hypothetical protein
VFFSLNLFGTSFLVLNLVDQLFLYFFPALDLVEQILVQSYYSPVQLTFNSSKVRSSSSRFSILFIQFFYDLLGLLSSCFSGAVVPR